MECMFGTEGGFIGMKEGLSLFGYAVCLVSSWCDGAALGYLVQGVCQTEPVVESDRLPVSSPSFCRPPGPDSDFNPLCG